jgi:exodeoxyribonuclease VII large subunit
MILRLTDALLKTAESEVDRLRIEVTSDIRHAITQGEMGLDRIWTHIRENSQEGIQASLHQLDRLMDHLRASSGHLIQNQELELQQLNDRILELSALRLDEASLEIEALAREILGVGPEATLRRGFAMVRDPRGNPLTSRRDALREKRLALEFHDGVLGVVPDSPGGKS